MLIKMTGSVCMKISPVVSTSPEDFVRLQRLRLCLAQMKTFKYIQSYCTIQSSAFLNQNKLLNNLSFGGLFDMFS